MKKTITILSSLLFLISCSFNNNTPSSNSQAIAPITNSVARINVNTDITEKPPISKEDFIENYHNGDVSIYSNKETNTIYNKIIETQEFDPYVLTKSDVLNILGSPNLIKNENIYENWQYRSTYCIINFVWDNNKVALDKIISYESQKYSRVPYKECILFIKNTNS